MHVARCGGFVPIRADALPMVAAGGALWALHPALSLAECAIMM
eukprot:CAMPEP_0171162778 /NCGR_PEP_ID=MMETSP0790-20130122/4771_1 /TAXON_ID=2925 /ORGANISM="Alexandrium catenella, Strain OF101" /LENGTH=42 /DNA_ID= /DNA_START= /DNA_END= /DNA_ORIENTATION=